MKKSLIILLIFASLFLQGCRTKKKLVEKEISKTERSEEKVVSEIKEHEIILDSIAESKTETVITNNNESIEVVTANDSTVVDIKKEIEPNSVRWLISGAKSFKIVKEKRKEIAIDSSVVQLARQETEKAKRNEQTQLDESTKQRKRNTDSESTGVSGWFYFWIVLIVILAALFLYLKFKAKQGAGIVDLFR